MSLQVEDLLQARPHKCRNRLLLAAAIDSHRATDEARQLYRTLVISSVQQLPRVKTSWALQFTWYARGGDRQGSRKLRTAVQPSRIG